MPRWQSPVNSLPLNLLARVLNQASPESANQSAISCTSRGFRQVMGALQERDSAEMHTKVREIDQWATRVDEVYDVRVDFEGQALRPRSILRRLSETREFAAVLPKARGRRGALRRVLFCEVVVEHVFDDWSDRWGGDHGGWARLVAHKVIPNADAQDIGEYQRRIGQESGPMYLMLFEWYNEESYLDQGLPLEHERAVVEELALGLSRFFRAYRDHLDNVRSAFKGVRARSGAAGLTERGERLLKWLKDFRRRWRTRRSFGRGGTSRAVKMQMILVWSTLQRMARWEPIQKDWRIPPRRTRWDPADDQDMRDYYVGVLGNDDEPEDDATFVAHH